jgi:hypothetical protein
MNVAREEQFTRPVRILARHARQRSATDLTGLIWMKASDMAPLCR